MSGFIKTKCPSCGNEALTPKMDDGSARPCNKCGVSFERKTKIELPPISTNENIIPEYIPQIKSNYKAVIENDSPKISYGETIKSKTIPFLLVLSLGVVLAFKFLPLKSKEIIEANEAVKVQEHNNEMVSDLSDKSHKNDADEPTEKVTTHESISKLQDESKKSFNNKDQIEYDPSIDMSSKFGFLKVSNSTIALTLIVNQGYILTSPKFYRNTLKPANAHIPYKEYYRNVELIGTDKGEKQFFNLFKFESLNDDSSPVQLISIENYDGPVTAYFLDKNHQIQKLQAELNFPMVKWRERIDEKNEYFLFAGNKLLGVYSANQFNPFPQKLIDKIQSFKKETIYTASLLEGASQLSNFESKLAVLAKKKNKVSILGEKLHKILEFNLPYSVDSILFHHGCIFTLNSSLKEALIYKVTNYQVELVHHIDLPYSISEFKSGADEYFLPFSSGRLNISEMDSGKKPFFESYFNDFNYIFYDSLEMHGLRNSLAFKNEEFNKRGNPNLITEFSESGMLKWEYSDTGKLLKSRKMTLDELFSNNVSMQNKKVMVFAEVGETVKFKIDTFEPYKLLTDSKDLISLENDSIVCKMNSYETVKAVVNYSSGLSYVVAFSPVKKIRRIPLAVSFKTFYLTNGERITFKYGANPITQSLSLSWESGSFDGTVNLPQSTSSIFSVDVKGNTALLSMPDKKTLLINLETSKTLKLLDERVYFYETGLFSIDNNVVKLYSSQNYSQKGQIDLTALSLRSKSIYVGYNKYISNNLYLNEKDKLVHINLANSSVKQIKAPRGFLSFDDYLIYEDRERGVFLVKNLNFNNANQLLFRADNVKIKEINGAYYLLSPGNSSGNVALYSLTNGNLTKVHEIRGVNFTEITDFYVQENLFKYIHKDVEINVEI